MKLNTRAKNALAGLGYENSPAILALVAFAAQNPGLDARDYGGYNSAYHGDARSISDAWKRFREALQEAAGEGVTDAHIISEAPHAFSGRLEWKDGKGWAYCTGQYFPTEYRCAAATLLEAAISKVRQARPPKAVTIRTISDLKAVHRANGWHWFDRSSMRFFNTRIESAVIQGRYFITSERMDETHPRRFTVRSFDAQGSIDTVGEFCGHLDKESARAAIRSLSAAVAA